MAAFPLGVWGAVRRTVAAGNIEKVKVVESAGGGYVFLVVENGSEYDTWIETLEEVEADLGRGGLERLVVSGHRQGGSAVPRGEGVEPVDRLPPSQPTEILPGDRNPFIDLVPVGHTVDSKRDDQGKEEDRDAGRGAPHPALERTNRHGAARDESTERRVGADQDILQ